MMMIFIIIIIVIIISIIIIITIITIIVIVVVQTTTMRMPLEAARTTPPLLGWARLLRRYHMLLRALALPRAWRPLLRALLRAGALLREVLRAGAPLAGALEVRFRTSESESDADYLLESD